MLSFALMVFVLLETGEPVFEKHYFDTPQACERAKLRATVQLVREEGVVWSRMYCTEEHTA